MFENTFAIEKRHFDQKHSVHKMSKKHKNLLFKFDSSHVAKSDCAKGLEKAQNNLL